jgi:hypothetical protein
VHSSGKHNKPNHREKGGRDWMKFFALFVVLALSVSVFAIQTPMEKFLAGSFEPDQSVQLLPIFADGNYVFVSVDGKETYVADNGTGKTLRDRQQLLALLVADAKNRTNFAAAVASATSFPSEINATKMGLEAKCIQYTGTDTHECTDRQSCVVACKSVPYCSGADGQSGPGFSDGFWEAVMQWTADRKQFDSLISSDAAGMEGIGSDSSLVEKKLAIANDLLSQAKKLANSTLFLNRTDDGCSGSNATRRCYEYCSKVNYSESRITAEIANLNALKNAYATIESQQQRTDAILNQSAQNDYYLSTRAGLFQDLRVRMQNKIKMLNESSTSLSQKVNDTAITGMLASISDLSSKIVEDGNAGLYRKALASKAAYDAKEKELNDRISSDLNAYLGLNSGMESLKAKAKNASWLIGNQSAASYIALADGIKSSLKSPASLTEISSAKADVDALNAKLADEVAAKAMQGGAQQQNGVPSGGAGAQGTANSTGGPGAAAGGFRIPCLPALVMLLLGFAVFSRRS